MAEIIVRLEEPQDFDPICRLHQATFGQPDESELVNRLRGAGILTYSVVALAGSELVGHMGFSPVIVSEPTGITACLGLAPLSVHPQFRHQGIAIQMFSFWRLYAPDEAYPLLFVLGNPEFYQKLGFEKARDYGFQLDGESFQEAFLVQELTLGALGRHHGKVSFHHFFQEFN